MDANINPSIDRQNELIRSALSELTTDEIQQVIVITKAYADKLDDILSKYPIEPKLRQKGEYERKV